MSRIEVNNCLIFLKEDLSNVEQLKSSERSVHFNNKSKPLLHKLFQQLGNESSLDDNQTSALCHYLLEYLAYDQDISIEASMGIYRLKQLNVHFNDYILEKVDNLIDLQTTKFEKYRVFIIVSYIFTIDPILGSEIFNKNTPFVNLLTNEITMITNGINVLTSESIKNVDILLKLFSNCCVDESSRSIVATMYINVILKCLTLSDTPNNLQTKCYAASTTIKLWRMIKPETLDNNSRVLSLNNLLDIILRSLSAGLFTSVEGLSLLATNVEVRNKIRTKEILNTLFELLSNHDHTRYGIISVFSLLTFPNRSLKVQQSSIMVLKDSNSIANVDILTNEKKNNNKVLDDKSQIQYVIDTIINKRLFTTYMVEIFKSIESSKGLIGECLKLMSNVIFPDIQPTEDVQVAKPSETYLSEIKQVIKFLTTYLIGTSQNFKYNHTTFMHLKDDSIQMPEKDLEYRSIAIKALTSPKISENIDLLFDQQSEETALSTALFILEIIVQSDIDNGTSTPTKRTPFIELKSQLFIPFDIYYAYVCLAALCSLNFDTVKETVFSLAFDSVMNMVSSSDEKLQFAALQLLNELCSLPLCIAKIFNWDNEQHDYYQNFSILVHLINSNNKDSQNCALQIFASLSNYGLVAEKLACSDLLCTNVMEVLTSQEQEQELIYYSLLIISNLFQLEANLKNSSLSFIKDSKSEILKYCKNSNAQISECARAVQKYL